MAAIQGTTSTSYSKSMIVTGEARINFIITNNTGSVATINLYSLNGAFAVRIAPRDYQIDPGKCLEVKDIVFNTNFAFQLDTTSTVEYYIWTTVGQSGQSIFEPIEITSSGGGGGSDARYEFEQVIASATWVIEHNLSKYPSVTIVTSSGDEVIGDLHYDSLNQVTLTFSGAFAGKAYLN